MKISDKIANEIICILLKYSLLAAMTNFAWFLPNYTALFAANFV